MRRTISAAELGSVSWRRTCRWMALAALAALGVAGLASQPGFVTSLVAQEETNPTLEPPALEDTPPADPAARLSAFAPASRRRNAAGLAAPGRAVTPQRSSTPRVTTTSPQVKDPPRALNQYPDCCPAGPVESHAQSRSDSSECQVF